jgi:hypothetical protein
MRRALWPIITCLLLGGGTVLSLNCSTSDAERVVVRAPATPTVIENAPAADLGRAALSLTVPIRNEIEYLYKSHGQVKVFEAPVAWKLSFTQENGALTALSNLGGIDFKDAITPNARMADSNVGAVTPIHAILQNVLPAGPAPAVGAVWKSAEPTAGQRRYWEQSEAIISGQQRDYRVEAAWSVGEYTVVRVRSVIFRYVADTQGLRNQRAALGNMVDASFGPGRVAIKGYGVADVIYGAPGSGFEGGLPVRVADAYLASEVAMDTPASAYTAEPTVAEETLCVAAVIGTDPKLNAIPLGIPTPMPERFRAGCTLTR